MEPTRRVLYAAVLVAIGLAPTGMRAADDLPIADFDGPDYGDWTATGEAFGKGPAHGTLPNQMEVYARDPPWTPAGRRRSSSSARRAPRPRP